jgi:hypothetical protein
MDGGLNGGTPIVGSYNIGIGTGNCLNSLFTGTYNLGIGASSLQSVVTKSCNVAVGANSLQYTTGENNTAIGVNAGLSNTSGSNNTYLGVNTNANAGTYSNSTAIGSGATITASNQIVLGTAAETINSIGKHYFNNGFSSYSTSLGTISTTTANFYAFPSAGVYLFLMAFSGNQYSTSLQSSDNLCQMCVVTCCPSYPAQVWSTIAGNKGNYFTITGGTAQYALSFTGSGYTYNYWMNKLF